MDIVRFRAMIKSPLKVRIFSNLNMSYVIFHLHQVCVSFLQWCTMGRAGGPQGTKWIRCSWISKTNHYTCLLLIVIADLRFMPRHYDKIASIKINYPFVCYKHHKKS